MRRIAALLAALIALAACGDDGSSDDEGTFEPVTTGHPTGADELVIQVQTGGGLVAPDSLALEIPAISIYGDGTFVVPGPETAQYPGNALPNLQQGRITEEELQELLQGAAAAGIIAEEPPDYGDPGVTDMPTTDIVVNGDTRYHVDIYALDFTEGDDNLDAEQRGARQAARDFIAMLPTDATEQYDPEAVAVLTRGFIYPTGLPDARIFDWPLDDLAGAGEPVEAFGADARCLIVAGPDADAVLAVAKDASEGVRWHSNGAEYALTFRPLLPHEVETGCENLRPGFVGA